METNQETSNVESDWRRELTDDFRGKMMIGICRKLKELAPPNASLEKIRTIAADIEESSYSKSNCIALYKALILRNVNKEIENTYAYKLNAKNQEYQQQQVNQHQDQPQQPQFYPKNVLDLNIAADGNFLEDGNSPHQDGPSGVAPSPSPPSTPADAFNDTCDAYNGNQDEPTPIQRIIRAVESMPPEILKKKATDMLYVIHDDVPRPQQYGDHANSTARQQVFQDQHHNQIFSDMSTCPVLNSEASSPSPLVVTMKNSTHLEMLSGQSPSRQSSSLIKAGTSNTSSVLPLLIPSASTPMKSGPSRLLGDSEKQPFCGSSRESLLLKEIEEMNERLKETVAEITGEDINLSHKVEAAVAGGRETVVKLTYTSKSTAHPALRQWVLIPEDYPNCSPILMDDSPVNESKESAEMSQKTRFRCSMIASFLSEPISLKELIKEWDGCARAAVFCFA